ncbi:MAG TPA: hypothetical protein PK874_05165 [Desulfobacteraceae bacterium]|nr:hypothetical protein [Desulfobacteraceae bacterium]HPJ69050.1 hypothetical protein [Desulfobacteraceae bacterium]HPQ27626.1 hypothetical protein [Desulfobacteraceae bacterium]
MPLIESPILFRRPNDTGPKARVEFFNDLTTTARLTLFSWAGR